MLGTCWLSWGSAQEFHTGIYLQGLLWQSGSVCQEEVWDQDSCCAGRWHLWHPVGPAWLIVCLNYGRVRVLHVSPRKSAEAQPQVDLQPKLM